MPGGNKDLLDHAISLFHRSYLHDLQHIILASAQKETATHSCFGYKESYFKSYRAPSARDSNDECRQKKTSILKNRQAWCLICYILKFWTIIFPEKIKSERIQIRARSLVPCRLIDQAQYSMHVFFSFWNLSLID